MSMFDCIRAAFAKPAPVLPRVSGCDYEIDRYQVNVLRSMGRLVQMGPYCFNLAADDWPSIKEAETAASRAVELIRADGHFANTDGKNIVEMLDDLADKIRDELKIDAARPYGCCLIVEPV